MEKATLLWPVRRWGMPGRMALNVLRDCAPPVPHQMATDLMRLSALSVSTSLEAQGDYFWAIDAEEADRLHGQ